VSTPLDSGGFDTPDSLPGYDMNAAIPGAHASPVGSAPSLHAGDRLEMEANASSGTSDIDTASALMEPSDVGGLNAANTAMGPNALSGMRASLSNLRSSGAGGGAPAAPAPGGAPGAPGGGDGGSTGGLNGGGGQLPNMPQQGGPQGGGGGPQQPGAPPDPGPIPGGFIGQPVPNPDGSLISALQSAASGAGRQASLMGPTVQIMGL
jgi:hypothetical protein